MQEEVLQILRTALQAQPPYTQDLASPC
jgi:hypothetical protein